jgi:hypothetical protein
LSGDFEVKLDGQDASNDDQQSALSVKRPTLNLIVGVVKIDVLYDVEKH